MPRVINLICETALVFSYGAGEKKITGEAIDEFIKNDASHLLLAINQEKRQASPDYGEVFDDDSNLIQDESLTSLLDEQDDDAPPARAHHMPAPNAARTETPAPRTLADEDITAASPFRQADKHATSDAAPAAAPETEEKAPSAAQDKSTDIDADIRPDDTDQREDETEELSLAELIKSTRSGRRWTREVIAIAAGVILGLGLVGWYLFDQSGDGRKASTAGTIDTPRTSEPSHQGERAEPGIGSDARPAAGTDFAHAARLNSEVGASTGAQDAAAQSVALGGTIGKIDPPVMPDSSPASRPSVSDQETETGASDSTDSTAMVEGSLAPVGTGTEDTTSPDTSRPALDTLASALQSLSLPVESMGPHAMKADFSQLIRFPDGSTTLDAGAKRILEDFSSLVKDLGSVRLKVIAHTDSKGGRESNRILSERRAKNVADFIQDLGIDRARIDHEGKGEDELKADPEQEKTLGPWVNRRVEIEIVEPQ
ncbi:OmpA family protein [Thiocystis violacea]|uniref:OmpA family protein n=1 Tax=Thiocystis violacea TaxID=13725 RepID=UPI0031F78239